MSAIAGLWRLDGRPGAGEQVTSMSARLAHRGRDGAGAWSDGPIALAHRLLHTTAESLTERQPLVSQDGSVVLVADARIDNRDELRAALGVAAAEAATWSDAAWILPAYERWGEGAPEHLLGDFAFALWDARRRVLVCARDQVGVKPFYYYHSPGRLFAFASEIKGLLALAHVPCRLNEVRVADYLASLLEDQEVTFYDGILRLPAAHRLIAGHAGLRIERYWSLDPARTLHLGSDADYAAAFRETFTDAVRCRLRSALPLGAMLSGGLDSSSVVCVARQLQHGAAPLHTFSVRFSEPACDERAYIDALLAGGGLEPHDIDGASLNPLAELDRLLAAHDEPFYAPNLFLHEAIYRAAARTGTRVLLDGLDGDSTVSHGLGSLHELARTGRWLRLAREVRAFGLRAGKRPRDVWRSQILVPFAPAAVRRAWARLRGKRSPGGIPALLHPDFARRIGLARRLAAASAHWPIPWRSERAEHHARLTTGVIPFALEIADASSATHGLEPRYPFFDRRLMELCLAFPSDQKLRDGWSRLVLRNAMEGILPPIVQWRGGKGSLSPGFTRHLAEGVTEPLAFIRRYANVAALSGLDAWKVVSLGRWLDKHVDRSLSITSGGSSHDPQDPEAHATRDRAAPAGAAALHGA
jgi:asparagine synthase (glutamine-hydrolysing)